ncbi:hypothetical protein [Streptomyces griseorubiginosus]|uniref:hypothetical protein n=1 Tax=Streptomyces griseorubiginosus TaxID=67304 RepID=UPI0036664F49
MRFDLVLLDSDTAARVSIWIKSGGELEARGRSGLLRCIHLHDMARLAADSPQEATE